VSFGRIDAGGFAGSLSVVVGGNQGIGAGVATRLSELGSNVILLGRNEQTLEQTAASIRDSSASDAFVEIRRVDVQDLQQLQRQVDDLISEHGAPRLLVNSAGGSLKKAALDVTPEDWNTVVDTHLRGTFFASQAVAKAMSAEGYGKIVNLSSIWASTVAPERSVYAVAKAGVSHLTAALAVEWAPLGIRVNAVAPSATYTPRVLARHEEDPAAARYSAERIPLGTLAEVRDVVDAVVYLASDAADFVTGHTLYVDGGWRFAK
jgi:2-deoxy-D-gluconate 3-dehydrogenase